MEKNRFSKPVAFNSKNESDKKILDHVKRRNFSGYVKKLILADIALKEASKSKVEETKNEQVNQTKETAAEKLARMQKQLKKRPNNVRNDTDGSTDS